MATVDHRDIVLVAGGGPYACRPFETATVPTYGPTATGAATAEDGSAHRATMTGGRSDQTEEIEIVLKLPAARVRPLLPRRGPSTRAKGVSFGLLSVALASVVLPARGGGDAKSSITVSVSSGQPGTVVALSGDAGPGCSPGHNWYGFSFQPAGQHSGGPATALTAPVATSGAADGTWAASFVVPGYLAGSSSSRAGSPVKAGNYAFVAKECNGRSTVEARFRVTTGVPLKTPGRDYVGIVATSNGQGYWLVQANGGVAAYGDARSYGSLPRRGITPSSPVVGMARTYDNRGYWLADSQGRVYDLGDARNYGSLPAGRTSSSTAITSIAPTPDGRGYWLLGENGKVYAFGDARSDGAPNTYSAPYDAIVARPGGGYIITGADDAENYAFPGDSVLGGGPGYTMSATLVGAASTPSGNGSWLAGRDGAVYTFGDAVFYGSVPGLKTKLKAPVTGIAPEPDGLGYWLVGSDGSVFKFGSARFFGSPTQPGK